MYLDTDLNVQYTKRHEPRAIFALQRTHVVFADVQISARSKLGLAAERLRQPRGPGLGQHLRLRFLAPLLGQHHQRARLNPRLTAAALHHLRPYRQGRRSSHQSGRYHY